MSQPFDGPDALNRGALTRGKLRWNYAATLPRVYLPNDAERTVYTNAAAVWLWTAPRGVVAGRAAAALHGARWIGAATPIDVIAEHTRPRAGVIVREERIRPDEITFVGEMAVTSPARTALDLGRHLPRDAAVAHLDALAVATGVTAADALALAERYRGARGLRQARTALALMDVGAQSPKETWLRLVLIDGGLSKPRTQIRVSDGRSEAFRRRGWTPPRSAAGS